MNTKKDEEKFGVTSQQFEKYLKKYVEVEVNLLTEQQKERQHEC